MRRSLNMGLLIFLVMVSTAACGAPGITTLAQSGTTTTLTIPLPLDGMAPAQIAITSLINLGNATSVRIGGTVSDSGRPLQMNVTLVKGVGCTGAFEETGLGGYQLIVMGKTIWIRGDAAVLRAQGVTSAHLSTLSAKYIKVTASSHVNKFAPLCGAAANVAGEISKATGLTQTKTIMNGQAVVELKDPANSAAMYVSDTATPEIIQMTDPATGGGSFTLSGFNQPAKIAAPSAGQTLDGAQFGM